jgi:hypothetical protein
MTRLLTLVGVAVLVASTSAHAQAKLVEDKKAVVFEEIERGFFFEVRGGFWATVNPPAAAGGKTYFSRGQAAEVDVGFDIGERVSPSIFFLASANTMGSDYQGFATGGVATGDYGMIMPGAAVKVRLLGLDDGQGVARTWLYVRAAGGAAFFHPGILLPKMDILISAGPGVEYFTRLRHFSIGIEANLNFMALTGSLGFSVLPTVKYAF